MNKSPAKRAYTVTGQIELDGETCPKGSEVQLTDEQAASAGDAVALCAPAAAAPAPAPAASPAAAKARAE